jgi:hypothetical protein
MAPGELCDVCGQEVLPEEAFKAEMSVNQLMCPTSMTLHEACYDLATTMWQPDDSYCGIDPDYPEMEAWTTVPEQVPEQVAGDAPDPAPGQVPHQPTGQA